MKNIGGEYFGGPDTRDSKLEKPETQVLEKKVASYQALSSYGFLHKGSFCRFRVFGFSGFRVFGFPVSKVFFEVLHRSHESLFERGEELAHAKKARFRR